MQATEQHIDFGYDRFLRIKPFYEKLHYGVMLAMFRNSVSNILKYEITVCWLAKKENYHIYEIDRLPSVFINEEEVDLVADQLAIQVASVLYPLQLRVSEQKGIIGIHNFTNIQTRWIQVKKKILDYNDGETVEKYLRINESILNNERALLQSLRNDWFLHGYFNRIYIPYGKNCSVINQISIPFIFDADGVKYEVTQTISPYSDERGYIISEIEGNYADNRSKADLENGLSYCLYPSLERVEGKYKAYYMLKGKDHSIEAFSIDTNLNLENDKKTISMVVSQIENNN